MVQIFVSPITRSCQLDSGLSVNGKFLERFNLLFFSACLRKINKSDTGFNPCFEIRKLPGTLQSGGSTEVLSENFLLRTQFGPQLNRLAQMKLLVQHDLCQMQIEQFSGLDSLNKLSASSSFESGRKFWQL